MWIHDVVPDLELDKGKRFGLEVLQVVFRTLCDGVLLYPAARGEGPAGVCF
jgi:hypothetical protein